MIDASASLFEQMTKSASRDKSYMNDKYQSKDFQGFSGYMTGASDKPSSKIKDNDNSPNEKRDSRERSNDDEPQDGSPVVSGVVEKPDSTSQEKVANILKQRANVLDKMSNNQDALAQKQVAAVEKMMDLDKVSDELISKLIEKLTSDKNKGELNFQNRLMMEKSLASSNSVDNMMSRLSADGADKNALLNSLNNTDRLNATSLQSMKLGIPVTSPEWTAEFGKRIQMLMKNNIQQAEIRMDPPELGRIQIKISMNQDQMNVSFTALNANVREALELNMTRLREMLSDTGIQLGDTNVGGEFQQEAHSRSDGSSSSNNPPGWVEDGQGDFVESGAAIVEHSIDGVIDYFA